MKILVGTKNQGKIKELREFLAELPVEIIGLDEFPQIIEPEETGTTFAENAALKARYYARETGIWVLSDDSGLEVEALGGAPGIFSARYAGARATDAERSLKILDELNQFGHGDRRARFVCAAAIADETGEIILETEGICHGVIARAPRGSQGFGYDPIFIPDGFKQTFGELSSTIKAEISHRALALKKILRFFRDFSAHQLDQ